MLKFQYCRTDGLTLIELIISMFIITVVILSMMSAFAKSISMVHSASHSSMALALAQESLEKVKYARDIFVRNDAVNGWGNFYKGFVLKSPDDTTTIGVEDKNPCNDTKQLRFLNNIGNAEPSEKYRTVSTKANNGRLIVFANPEDREKILFLSGSNQDKEPVVFYRKIMCKQVGNNYNRDAGDVLEFVTQIDWEFEGTNYALPMKMEIAR